ncbi:hypothetical protein [Mesonia mobilis]|nr:hypothetical protein [Mesonia mobilis]
MYGAILLGTLILPEYFGFYVKSFLVGKEANPFHHFDYEQVLHLNYFQFKSMIFSEKIIKPHLQIHSI